MENYNENNENNENNNRTLTINEVINNIPEGPKNPNPSEDNWLVPDHCFSRQFQDFVNLINQSEWYNDRVIINNVRQTYVNKKFWNHLFTIDLAYRSYLELLN